MPDDVKGTHCCLRRAQQVPGNASCRMGRPARCFPFVGTGAQAKKAVPQIVERRFAVPLKRAHGTGFSARYAPKVSKKWLPA